MSKVGAFSSTPVMPPSPTNTESVQRPVASQDVPQQSPTGWSSQDSFASAPTNTDTLRGRNHFRKIGVPGSGGGD